MKVLLLGKNGMLGSLFLKHLAGGEDFEMFATDREDVDVTDTAAITSLCKRVSPDFVINCAAYTAVDDCESNKQEAFRVNAEAVQVIAEACRCENAILIHFSTDYVFDGEKAEGYGEEDIPSPINVYGESKLRGEQFIKDNCANYHIIRTSWLFGPNGKNFVDTMIQLGRKRSSISVVCDQIGSPTYTNDLCHAVIRNFLAPSLKNLPKQHEHMLHDSDVNQEDPAFGIYHITNSGFCSWYEFAVEVFRLQSMRVEVVPVASGKFPCPAKRPHYSILKNVKLPALRPWQEALRVYLDLKY